MVGQVWECVCVWMLNGGDWVSRQVSPLWPPEFVTRSDLGTEPESDWGGRNFPEEKICDKNPGKLRLTSHLSSEWFLFGIKPPLLAQWSQGLRSFGQKERSNKVFPSPVISEVHFLWKSVEYAGLETGLILNAIEMNTSVKVKVIWAKIWDVFQFNYVITHNCGCQLEASVTGEIYHPFLNQENFKYKIKLDF